MARMSRRPYQSKSQMYDGADPRQVFWETTLNRASCVCGARAEMVCTTSCLISDLAPEVRAATMIEISQRKIRPFNTKKGFAVRTGVMYACAMHRKAMEHAAAQGPSYAIVEFDYGPGALQTIVQVQA